MDQSWCTLNWRVGKFCLHRGESALKFHFHDQKIKKESFENPHIELVKNPDIIAGLAKIKKHQFILGFALETQDVLNNGNKKLKAKNLDAIVLNSLEDPGAGFGHKTNKVQFLSKKNGLKSFPLKPKSAVASDIWAEILKELWEM